MSLCSYGLTGNALREAASGPYWNYRYQKGGKRKSKHMRKNKSPGLDFSYAKILSWYKRSYQDSSQIIMTNKVLKWH